MSDPSLPEKVVAIDQGLAEASLDHAFGGAIALAYYAEPRATIDVDVNVFCPPQDHARIRGALVPLGIRWEIDATDLEREGQCRIWWERTPVDLFFAYDAIHEAMKASVRRVPFGADSIPILGPEHLLVCKAAFDRAQDWLDIEQILISSADLDLEEIRGWLNRILGPADPRVERFEDVADR